MNNHVLINYGIVTSFHNIGKSITTTFLPLVEYGIAIINSAHKDYYDKETLIELIYKKSGVKIPILTLNNLLKRLERDGSIELLDREHFKITNSAKIDTNSYIQEMNSTERRLNKFIDEYRKFAGDERDDNQIKESLYKFIQIRSQHDVKVSVAKVYEKFFKFIEYIYYKEDELVKTFQDINFGYTLCSLLEREENLDNIKLKDFTIYLDSNFILRLLDLQEECFSNETRELFGLLKKSGAKLLVFKETLQEVINVIEYYKQKYILEKSLYSSVYEASRINGVFGAFFRKKLTVSQIETIMDNIEKNINELGIYNDSIERYSPKVNENNILKLYEKKYGETTNIDENYRYYKCKNYISIIEIIKWRRNKANVSTRCFGNCKYIFLTCDWKLYRYNLSNKQITSYPEIIIQEAIIDNLILFFPENYSKLSTEFLISAYQSSQYLNIQDLSDLNSNIETIIKEDSELSSYVIRTTTNVENYGKIAQLYSDGDDTLDGLKKVIKEQMLKEQSIENSKQIEQQNQIVESFEAGKASGKQEANAEYLKSKAKRTVKIKKAIKYGLMGLFCFVPLLIIILLLTKVIVVQDSDLNEATKWIISVCLGCVSAVVTPLIGKFFKIDEEQTYNKLNSKTDKK